MIDSDLEIIRKNSQNPELNIVSTIKNKKHDFS